MTPRINLYVRQPDFTRGRPIDDFIQFKPTPRFNDVGTWTLDLNLESRAAEELLSDEGYGIMSSRSGSPLLSGPTESRTEVLSSDGRETLQLAGPDDNVWLIWRLVTPAGPPSYNTAAYDIQAGNAETVMRNFVNRHLGPGAASERQLPGLTQDANLGRGTDLTEQGRFQTLMEMLQRTASEGGGLGFRLVQDGDHLEFRVYQPVDRSDTVTFGPGFGNISERKYQTKGPSANFVIIGGSGEGTDRILGGSGDEESIAKWGRREQFVDRRDTSDIPQLIQAYYDAITKGAEQHSLAITPIETQPEDYAGKFKPYYLLDDYFVGDVVTNNVRGVKVKEQITSAEITVTGKSTTIKPVFGSDPDLPDIFDAQRKLARRVGSLETR